mgnify:CR=1 FL=1
MGVSLALRKLDQALAKEQPNRQIYTLGPLIHNPQVLADYEAKGVFCAKPNQNLGTNDCVVIRAHGIPCEMEKKIRALGARVIDATCPIVLRLHKMIKENATAYSGAQTVIFGKKDHAEVVGLNGQVDDKAIIISSEKEIDKIDFSRSILLYSQTTMNSSDYDKVAEKIAETITSKKSCIMFKKFDTVCRSVAGREKKLEGFAAHFDAILFVAGANSSNGKYLYTSCKNVNPNTYYISSEKDFEPQMFSKVKKLGITGATSTPKWLLQRVAEAAAKI